jgi:CheY-like chemotaxis protein
MGKHILVVDDEREFQFSAEIALRKAGYRAEAAGDGLEALEKITGSEERSDPFDLIVLDIRMPRMTGIELLDEMGRRGIFIPVFVMTCFVEKGLARELEGKGCLDVIEKPFPPQELVGRIGELFAKVSDPGKFLQNGGEVSA